MSIVVPDTVIVEPAVAAVGSDVPLPVARTTRVLVPGVNPGAQRPGVAFGTTGLLSTRTREYLLAELMDFAGAPGRVRAVADEGDSESSSPDHGWPFMRNDQMIVWA